MTRLAHGRTTHLERAEIAAETLRFFDAGDDPSIRQLASALQVTPSAIYHHFASRAEIVQAAVDIVWQEILVDLLARVGDPFETDPFPRSQSGRLSSSTRRSRPTWPRHPSRMT